MTAIEARASAPPAGPIAVNCSALTVRQQRAAELVARDELADTDIARRVRVAQRTLEYWKRRPDFAALVVELRGRYRERVLSLEGFADKVNRVKALNTVATALLGQMSRAEYQAAIGMTDSGEPIMAFDPGRLREFRAYLEQIAVEVGDRDKRDGGVNVGVAVKVYTDRGMADIFDPEAWHDGGDTGQPA
jgi:Helix-turn-helix of insertion element transposase